MFKHLPQKPLFSLFEFSKIIGRDPRTVYRMIDDREVKAIRVRNRWMFTFDAVVNYINTCKSN